jgi:hypothetical protein
MRLAAAISYASGFRLPHSVSSSKVLAMKQQQQVAPQQRDAQNTSKTHKQRTKINIGHSANQTIWPSFSLFQLSHFSPEIVTLMCSNKGISPK